MASIIGMIYYFPRFYEVLSPPVSTIYQTLALGDALPLTYALVSGSGGLFLGFFFCYYTQKENLAKN